MEEGRRQKLLSLATKEGKSTKLDSLQGIPRRRTSILILSPESSTYVRPSQARDFKKWVGGAWKVQQIMDSLQMCIISSTWYKFLFFFCPTLHTLRCWSRSLASSLVSLRARLKADAEYALAQFHPSSGRRGHSPSAERIERMAGYGWDGMAIETWANSPSLSIARQRP